MGGFIINIIKQVGVYAYRGRPLPQPLTELNHYHIVKVQLFPHINKGNSFKKLLTLLVYVIGFTSPH
jgi:hypothetical protein